MPWADDPTRLAGVAGAVPARMEADCFQWVGKSGTLICMGRSSNYSAALCHTMQHQHSTRRIIIGLILIHIQANNIDFQMVDLFSNEDLDAILNSDDNVWQDLGF